jgi:hypothetical protein
MNFFKKHLGFIVLTIILASLDIYHKEFFFTIFLLYGLIIKFFLSDSLGEKLRKMLMITVWTAFLIATFLFYYSNHHFPRGPMFDTGDVVCQNDGRGPCAEEYIEDPRYLDIPEWAKFFKRSDGKVLWLGLLFAGIVVSKKKGEEESN